MIRAIVYKSNTGFTKKYAELLSAETGLPYYALSENRVKSGEPVIFMGWLSAGKIKGYSKALKKYDVRAVAGVGLRAQDSAALNELITQNKISDVPAFYLRGGLDMNRLRGMNKFLLKMFYKMMSDKAKDGDAEALEIVDAYRNNKDFVSLENLKEMLDWYRSAL
ncbi:MAG TPA: flavodoxin domain-containing protein [Clostridiales bacterium]|jgi:hypothetical protein|nr:flavodoxin domain-containing protein [Clostridiales bacterium]